MMIVTCRAEEGNSLCGAAEEQMIVLGLIFSSVSVAHLGCWGSMSLLAVRLHHRMAGMNLRLSPKNF